MTWTQQQLLEGRAEHASAYDPTRGHTILFGGRGAAGVLADTWEWDGASWLRLSPLNSPPARSGHALALDAGRSRLLLFGGVSSSGTPLADTWEWDGNDWSPLAPLTRPSARSDHALAYHGASRRLVLFGGASARYRHALAYDSARERVVLFGGFDHSTGLTADLWEWDGNDWTQRLPIQNPEARMSHALAYDSTRGRTVLFGGGARDVFNDTWELGPVHPASHATFGSGCAGTAGVPSLRPRAGQSPWAGDRFTLDVNGLPAGAPVLLTLGRSKTSWNGLGLPLDLGLAGMPGCWLLASGEVLLTVTKAGGGGSASLTIPADPVLAGVAFYDQALVFGTEMARPIPRGQSASFDISVE